jgi:predicted amidohydrolase YtcJ
MGDKHDLSRRGFLGAAAGVTAGAAVGAGAQAAQAQPGSAPPGVPSGGDVALVNGKIHTFDENNSVVSQVLIRDGRFAAVGSVGGGAPQVINLHGRTVIPGLIDNHCHFIRIGQAVGHDLRLLETAFSIEAAQQIIADKAATLPAGEFITALAGIARRQFGESPARFPNLQELDDAAPNHPVVISELFAAQTNTLGRDRLRDLGVEVADDGSTSQGAAYGALAQFITMETKKRELLSVADYALSRGLTTVMDDHGSAGGAAGTLDRVTGHDHYLELVREKTLNVRTRARFPETSDVAVLQEIVNRKWREFGSDMHQISGIGEWAPRGGNYQTSLRIIAERGFLYHQHLISTGEIQNHLDAFRQFMDENPNLPTPGELHWSLGHVGNITESQVLEANDLGVGLAPHGWRYLTANTGEPNFRMIVDLAEVPVGTGLDGARVAPLNPWAGIYFMVTGRNSGGDLVNDGMQLTREEAIRLYAGPQQGWFSKDDDRLGGIVEGRYADLVVLDKDLFDASTVPDEDIRTMSSVLTIVDGRVVYDAGVL